MEPNTFSDLSVGTKTDSLDLSDEELVVAYHERTKHHYHRYAASLGYLDWAKQPDPFRRYDGAPLVSLPLPAEGRALPFWQLYVRDSVVPAPLSVESISLFLRYSLSLTAWKQFQGTKWPLRANPSSGNLHPTEGYALLPSMDRLHDRAGIYHYAPKAHGLELRANLDPSFWASFPEGSFLVGLSSIFWREAWKYGERAFRYCQLDVGHALGALRYAAAVLGWKVRLLDRVSRVALARLLGLDRDADYVRAEREDPELVALVVRDERRCNRALSLSEELITEVANSQWCGKANVLTPEHGVEWPIIDQVAAATMNPKCLAEEEFSSFASEADLFGAPVRSGAFTAEKVILERRSAVSMDASTTIAAATFFRMLARLVPTRDGDAMPWDVLPWRPRIHLGLFVHRVNDVAPGLYLLARDPERVTSLRRSMRPEFLWQRPPSCPQGLPLFLLKEGDCRALAANVCCGQDIAGDGAFSLGMISEFRDSFVVSGAGFYRNLYWEAGLVGQVLYLEAEEAGIRATGIGCYFDDPVHEVFGISSRDWQSLYHFTVGGPVEDGRLIKTPALQAHEDSTGRRQAD
jgi:SagB-type dehydrogenase family enzyme